MQVDVACSPERGPPPPTPPPVAGLPTSVRRAASPPYFASGAKQSPGRPAGRPTDRLKTEWTINRPNGRANKLSKCLLTWIARPLRNQIIFPARFNSDVFLSSSAVPFSSDMVPVRATTVHEKTRDIYKVGSINLFREGIFSLHSLSSFSFFFSSFPLPFPSS